MNFVAKMLAAVLVPLAQWLAEKGISFITMIIRLKAKEKKTEKAIDENNSDDIDNIING